MKDKETLEEAAKNYAEENDNCYTNDYYGFVKGAKWKEEQMHSDKIINILDDITYWDNCPEEYKETISLFIKQFKKK